MMQGVVNLRREATFSLVVGNLDGQRQFINTVIDTGFDGFLSLPADLINRLGLPFACTPTGSSRSVEFKKLLVAGEAGSLYGFVSGL